MYSKRRIWFALTSLLILISFEGCSTSHADRQLTSSVWKHSAVFLSSSRIEVLRDRIEKQSEPNFSAWLKVKRNCDDGLSHEPHPVEKWAIPGFYDVHDAHEQDVDSLRRDSTLAYEEALCFRITDDSKYAKQSIRLLRAWASVLKESDTTLADTKLSMNEFVAPMIVAADLLETSGEWNEREKLQFKKFVREIVLPLNTMEPKKNNHADWGVFLVLCSAAYLDDLALFDQAEARLRSLIDMQIGDDGTMVLEYDRSDTGNWHGGPTKGKNGIWYSNYALMPIALAAEVLLQNGRDFFNYRSPEGKSLRLAFEKVSLWDRHPETFPFYKSNHGQVKGAKAVSYFEILNRHWPNQNALDLLNELRPLTSEAGIPHLTLTHGGF